MKHEVTTYNTKKLLAKSLKKAMSKKQFSKITVSEIVNDCGVNRKTFYYHFEDIFALLKWTLEEEAIDVIKHFNLVDNYTDAIIFAMEYIEKNDYIINCAYDSMGRDEMKRFFFNDFIGVILKVIEDLEKKKNVTLEYDFKIYLAKFYTEALSGMLIDWAKDAKRENKEKTLKYITAIIEAAMSSDFNI